MYVNATCVSVPDIPPPDKFPKFGIVDVFPVFPDYPAILEEIKKEENRKKKTIVNSNDPRRRGTRISCPTSWGNTPLRCKGVVRHACGVVLALRFLFCFFPHEKTGFLALIQQIIIIFFPLLCAIIKYTPRSWAPARKKNACRLELVSPRKTIFPQKQTKKHIRPGVTKQALTPPPSSLRFLRWKTLLSREDFSPFFPRRLASN